MTSARTLILAIALSTTALPALAQQAPRPSFTPVDVPSASDNAGGNAPGVDVPNPERTPGAQQSGPNGESPVYHVYPKNKPQNVDKATLDRAERQNNGEFTPIDRSATSGPGVPLGTTQDAWSKPSKHMSEGQVSPGVIRFRWRPELVMPMRVREFMITTITLPEWEKADEVLIGEDLYFQGKIVRDNTVAIKATASGIDTSVNVIGSSGNNYTFYVRSEPFNTTQLTDLTVFVDAAPATQAGDWFRAQGGLNNGYPESDGPKTPGGNGEANPDMIDMDAYGRTREGGGEAGSGRDHTSKASSTSVAGAQWYIPKEDMIFSHKMYEVNDGDRAVAPNTVYTNGVWTFFHYGKRAATVDHPVVYRVVDGVETLVNTRWIGSNNEVLVAEATGDFVLRNGARTVCILRKEERTPTAGDGHASADSDHANK